MSTTNWMNSLKTHLHASGRTSNSQVSDGDLIFVIFLILVWFLVPTYRTSDWGRELPFCRMFGGSSIWCLMRIPCQEVITSILGSSRVDSIDYKWLKHYLVTMCQQSRDHIVAFVWGFLMWSSPRLRTDVSSSQSLYRFELNCASIPYFSPRSKKQKI